MNAESVQSARGRHPSPVISVESKQDAVINLNRAPVIPVTVWPGDWCMNCSDPSHGDMVCPILEYKPSPTGIIVEACGCEKNLILGVQGKYLTRVTSLQKE